MSLTSLPSTTAAVLYGPRDIRLQNRPLWPPSSGQVQVKVVATGLCGSDLHYYSHGRNGDFAVRAPLVLGHESAGIVTAVSPGSNLHVGQRVAIEAGIFCRSCPFCLGTSPNSNGKPRYNLCKNMRFCSSAARFPHVDGTLQKHINHPAYVLHPIPDDVSFDLAALAEPLSVLIHASRRCGLVDARAPSKQKVHPQSVMVFGVGAIGLLACALAKHRGASKVVAVDINPTRLEFAKREGFADDVYCIPPPSSSTSTSAPLPDACCSSSSTTTTAPTTPRELADEQLKKAKEGAVAALSHFGNTDGYDVVYECTGAESAIQMSIFSASTGGKVMLIGMGTRAAYIPLSTAALREVDVLGSFRYADTYPEALELLCSASKSQPNGTSTSPSLPSLVAKLVTHRFKLSETSKAFEMLARGVDDQGGLVLKVVVGSEEDDD
ncbi:GroES-like protein [Agrocybe pediades]|nr:GroES-like protein [Agrocybe pediades]